MPEQKDDEKTPPPKWDHGPLLPVRVVLRDFAARGLPDRGATGIADDLWKFLESELGRGTVAGYAPHLKETLLRDGGLILLDGPPRTAPAAAGASPGRLDASAAAVRPSVRRRNASTATVGTILV